MNGIFELLSLIIGVLVAIFMKDQVQLDEEDLPKKIENLKIKIEQIEDMYYAWHENDFIVQSKQVEDVLDHIKQKFPNKNFLIVSNKDLSQWLAKN
jgi:hypothetical protein